ncbi:FMN-binding negative transcriptional regulator [Herbaspirillum sp. RTI4]|uniref:FMN-binding negative transcriptional regulator n=1 Tax=Herbaspirillum sp. RTI4 TaxID=3048640 RepID=UPI002AB4442E|nr:FMN-binding negative transcriptional regulator [Herbaspirillum sp. RTI4]MDY7579961.1 FMN-binding negative transcriptional regulator [Herbaspirillum sp. RTI4]MEA9982895.1 FMN-binding negative transcriptional regulator [Herbaspirillum sp. RTI4]
MNPIHDPQMTSEECLSFMQGVDFGSIFTPDLQVSHLPFLFKEDGKYAYAHFARANPQAAVIDGSACLMSFLGAHTYISTKYYVREQAVPTWNYAALTVKGVAHVQTHEELLASLDEMLERFQPSLLSDKVTLPDEYRNQLSKGIIGVKIDITQISGKAKFGQHRSMEDQQSVISHLLQGSEHDKQYATFVRDWLGTNRGLSV